MTEQVQLDARHESRSRSVWRSAAPIVIVCLAGLGVMLPQLLLPYAAEGRDFFHHILRLIALDQQVNLGRRLRTALSGLQPRLWFSHAQLLSAVGVFSHGGGALVGRQFPPGLPDELSHHRGGRGAGQLLPGRAPVQSYGGRRGQHRLSLQSLLSDGGLDPVSGDGVVVTGRRPIPVRRDPPGDAGGGLAELCGDEPGSGAHHSGAPVDDLLLCSFPGGVGAPLPALDGFRPAVAGRADPRCQCGDGRGS